jgi:hypothetical protein
MSVFWDAIVIIHIDFVKARATVISDDYIQILKITQKIGRVHHGREAFIKFDFDYDIYLLQVSRKCAPSVCMRVRGRGIHWVCGKYCSICYTKIMKTTDLSRNVCKLLYLDEA